MISSQFLLKGEERMMTVRIRNCPNCGLEVDTGSDLIFFDRYDEQTNHKCPACGAFVITPAILNREWARQEFLGWKRALLNGKTNMTFILKCIAQLCNYEPTEEELVV